MIDNLSQITAQELADLQKKELDLLLSGDLSPDELGRFLSLTKENRRRTLALSTITEGEITEEQSRWFVTLTPQKREQLLIIMPPVKEKEPEPIDSIESGDRGTEKEEVPESTSEIFSRIRTPQILAQDTSILKLISAKKKIIVNAFDFEETKKDGIDIFEAVGFDASGFEKGCEHLKSNRTPDPPKPKVAVLVYELAQNATFSEIFGSIGVDLTRLCFKAEQIRNFCLKHSEWLNTKGYPTFFLFRDGSEYFVVRVLFEAEYSSLKIIEESLFCETIWLASRFRHFVVPDLNNQEF